MVSMIKCIHHLESCVTSSKISFSHQLLLNRTNYIQKIGNLEVLELLKVKKNIRPTTNKVFGCYIPKGIKCLTSL